MNLLDASASRRLVRSAAGMRPRGDLAMDDFERDVQVGCKAALLLPCCCPAAAVLRPVLVWGGKAVRMQVRRAWAGLGRVQRWAASRPASEPAAQPPPAAPAPPRRASW
jgi:hypothetical protein